MALWLCLRQDERRRRAARAQCAVVAEEVKMEVFVSAPSFKFSGWVFPDDSVVRDVLNRFSQQQVSIHTEQGIDPMFFFNLCRLVS